MAKKSKLTTCKACGNEIAKSAKVCPNCGAKNKKPIYKRVWFILLVIIVVFAAGSAMMGGSDDTNENISYTKVDVATLDNKLEKNAMNAEEKYNDQYLEVTGVLNNIDSDGEYFSLGEDEYDLYGIQIYIPDDEFKDEVKEMKTGNTYTVRVHITDIGEVIGYEADGIEIVK